MAAYRRVYDPRHLQADCQNGPVISFGTLRSVIEYGLPFYLFSLFSFKYTVHCNFTLYWCATVHC